MLKVNEYFEGRVKSIGFENAEGRATLGVMEPGAYEFGTSSPERMRIVSGALSVRLPGETDWRTYAAGQAFEVPAGVKFELRVEAPAAYLCLYG
jgi:hypothetical protein